MPDFREDGKFAPGNKYRFQPGNTICYKGGLKPKKRELYMNIFNWLKEHINEPMLVSDNEEDEPIVNIWFTILNHDPNMFDPKTNYATEYANSFIRTVANYIPEFRKETDFYVQRWIDPITQPEFCQWFIEKKGMLENYMSKEYFMKGRMKDESILKRRFKRTWSEQKIVDAKLEADQNIKSDNKVEIVIKDA